MKPTITRQELAETVARMEARLGGDENTEVQALLAHYRQLLPRFNQDLADPRDAALAASAALMLVQSVAQAKK
ncbi:hypothetical protein [Chromobacterium alticapitis]|uniref:Uncharacterized protein n=1 Tax=Chromobacterium alticapitis TaxID=2073169 RepID=A0A2S5DCG4_9NEIS|nr:hypothetical protein [Chromobacterium alticapitis]POZ60724.1 hypothetical protein C2I19_17140 [Chromobacterium alticapitis]